jgi:hypothetical protein
LIKKKKKKTTKSPIESHEKHETISWANETLKIEYSHDYCLGIVFEMKVSLIFTQRRFDDSFVVSKSVTLYPKSQILLDVILVS